VVSPGPGSYELRQSSPSLAHKSARMNGKTKPPRSSTGSPGVGSYELSSDIGNQLFSSRQYKYISKAGWSSTENAACKSPGPGTYSPQETGERVSPSKSFPRADSSTLLQSVKGMPGPGAYESHEYNSIRSRTSWERHEEHRPFTKSPKEMALPLPVNVSRPSSATSLNASRPSSAGSTRSALSSARLAFKANWERFNPMPWGRPSSADRQLVRPRSIGKVESSGLRRGRPSSAGPERKAVPVEGQLRSRPHSAGVHRAQTHSPTDIDNVTRNSSYRRARETDESDKSKARGKDQPRPLSASARSTNQITFIKASARPKSAEPRNRSSQNDAKERRRWEKSMSELKMRKSTDELNDWDEETDDEELLFDCSEIDSSEVEDDHKNVRLRARREAVVFQTMLDSQSSVNNDFVGPVYTDLKTLEEERGLLSLHGASNLARKGQKKKASERRTSRMNSGLESVKKANVDFSFRRASEFVNSIEPDERERKIREIGQMNSIFETEFYQDPVESARFIEWRAGSKTKKGTLGPSRKVTTSEESPTRTPSMLRPRLRQSSSNSQHGVQLNDKRSDDKRTSRRASKKMQSFEAAMMAKYVNRTSTHMSLF